MDQLVSRSLTIVCGAAAALLLLAGPVRAQDLDANAQFCEDFDQTVIIGGQIDQASRFLTADFKEHNAGLTADGLDDFVQKLTALRQGRGQRGGGARAGGGAGRGQGQGRGAAPAAERTVFSHDDVVVFLRPNADGTTHFDVYRLENGKIAEHWD